jgi:hypothetical protein
VTGHGRTDQGYYRAFQLTGGEGAAITIGPGELLVPKPRIEALGGSGGLLFLPCSTAIITEIVHAHLALLKWGSVPITPAEGGRSAHSLVARDRGSGH